MAFSRREQFIADVIGAHQSECVIWPFAVRASSGYGAHSFRSDGVKHNVDAHRHVCQEAHGPALPGQQAAHMCGNKLCVNPSHLYWADPSENMADAKRHGTLKGGGRYRQRIFSAEIKDICASSESLVVLAARYGSDPSYIGRLKRQFSKAA
jgi:hypothetical protein